MPPEDPPDDRPPPLPTDLDGYERSIAWYEGKLRFHVAMAEQIRDMLNTLERRRDLLEAGHGIPVLTTKDGPSTVDSMQPGPSANALRASAQLDAHRDHKFVAMLVKRKLTVNLVASRLSVLLGRVVPRNTVQSWYKKKSDPGHRRIPQDAAEAIEREYGVPVSAWPNVKPTE